MAHSVFDVTPSGHVAFVVEVGEFSADWKADRSDFGVKDDFAIGLQKGHVVEVASVFFVDFDLYNLR